MSTEDAGGPGQTLGESTHEGWRRFAASDRPSKPEIDRDSYMRLEGLELRAWRRRRLRYNQSVHVQHPDLRAVTEQARDMLDYNRFTELGAGESRTGLVIDGEPRTGKTRAAMRIGREHTRIEWAEAAHRGLDLSEVHPVVYVDLQGPTRYLTLAAQLLEFFASIPNSGRPNAERMWRAFISHARRCRTSLVIINDLHQVAPTDSKKRTPTYLLKSVLEDLGASLLCTANGADRIEGVFMHGKHTPVDLLEQIAGRLQKTSLDPYPHGPQFNGYATSLDQWAQLIFDFESQLHLYDHEPGHLVAHTEELLNLSRGRIGVLASLLRRSAHKAIKNPDDVTGECITMDAIRRLPLDHATSAARTADQ